MLFTLGDARAAVARFVESGTCNVTLIDSRINEALARLTDMADWECMRKMVRLAVVDGNIGLPYSVEKLLWANVDGTPVRIFGKPYQFLSSGPGDLDYTESGTILKNLQDMGDSWPTLYEVPESYVDPAATDPEAEITNAGVSLYAFGSSQQDAGKFITVRGVNARDESIDVQVPINRWANGVEGVIRGPFTGHLAPVTSEIVAITKVSKPVTAGYVSLFAVDVPRTLMFFLAKYAPGDTLPQFRRYSVIGAGVPAENCLLALARLRFVPLTDPEDIVPIDSLPALKFMVMAIREENAGNIQGSMNFEGKAKMVMDSRQEASTMGTGTQIVMDFDHTLSLGRGINQGQIL